MGTMNPLIMLAGHAPQVQDPIAVAQEQQRLKLLSGAQQLQQQQIVGAGLQNQETQQAITDDQNFRKLFQQSMQSGQPIDPNQVMSTLGPVRGAAWNKSQLELAEATSRLQHANDEHATAEQDWSGAQANSLLKTLDNNGRVDPQLLAQTIRQAQALGYKDEANQLAQVASQNPQAVTQVLKHLVDASNKQRTVAAEEKNATARDQQAQNTAGRDKQLAGYQAGEAELNAEKLVEEKQRDAETKRYHDWQMQHGNTLADQGQERIDNSPANNRATNGLTLGQNNTAYNKAEADEREQDNLRQQLSDAQQNGLYVKPGKNGATVPFESVIPKQGSNEKDDDYQARFDKAKAGLQKEMQARYRQATSAANALTAKKNSYLAAAGETPDVSTEDAIAARGGSPQQPKPQAGTAQAAQYLKFANDGKGNRLGFNAATRRWEPVRQ